MLVSEWMVTEQNLLYLEAQGTGWTGLRAPLDFSVRAARKVLVRAAGGVGAGDAKAVSKLAARLQLGDARIGAHTGA